MARIKKLETSEAVGAVVPYSQGTETDGLIFVSEQLPVDPKTGQMVEEDITVQTHRVIENIRAVLKAAGSDLSRVVRCNVFLKDMNDCKAINEVYASKFVSDPKPARQAVQVGQLPLDAMVEISCIVCKGIRAHTGEGEPWRYGFMGRGNASDVSSYYRRELA